MPGIPSKPDAPTNGGFRIGRNPSCNRMPVGNSLINLDGGQPSDGDVSLIEWMYGSTCGRRFAWSLVRVGKVVCREKYPGVG